MFPIQPSPNIAGREFVRVNDVVVLARDEGETRFTVWLDHQRIPNVEAAQNEDGTWAVFIESFIFPLGGQTPEQVEQIFRLVAHGMAFAAGFSCFGEGSAVINPYRKYPPPNDAAASRG